MCKTPPPTLQVGPHRVVEIYKEKNQEIILIRNTIVKNEAKQVNIINQSLESIFEKLSPQGNPYPSPFPLKTK